ncbi:helix-turn-helix domain-containing protein [Ensifer sp. SSB1]|uniref:helix-turn-helix domain-containing protein n=1 Tax=Ensifer sp. SSB1 TaxID=2795385 RepID=UPI001A4A21CB|nr:helix-turn-helix domain-containing protein [Ensifer sp. SSB1]MBK5565220.1 helix-turn-helix domain-containing protein [Ensifer sp. SSB1]
MSDSPLIKFVRALARHKARQDAASGIIDESIERYATDPSEQNAKSVLASMGQALESLFQRAPTPAARLESPLGPPTSAENMPTKELPRVLTPSMLAEEWACSEQHVRNLIKNGKLPHFKLGGKLVRIRREDVEAFERNVSTAADQEAGAEKGKVPERPVAVPKRERAARLDRPGLAPVRGPRKR